MASHSFIFLTLPRRSLAVLAAGTMVPCTIHHPASSDVHHPWHHGTRVPWSHIPTVAWYHDTKDDFRRFGPLHPWHHGTRVPWYRPPSTARQPMYVCMYVRMYVCVIDRNFAALGGPMAATARLVATMYVCLYVYLCLYVCLYACMHVFYVWGGVCMYA